MIQTFSSININLESCIHPLCEFIPTVQNAHLPFLALKVITYSLSACLWHHGLCHTPFCFSLLCRYGFSFVPFWKAILCLLTPFDKSLNLIDIRLYGKVLLAMSKSNIPALIALFLASTISWGIYLVLWLINILLCLPASFKLCLSAACCWADSEFIRAAAAGNWGWWPCWRWIKGYNTIG